MTKIDILKIVGSNLVWQTFLICAVLYIALRLIPKDKAELRYRVSLFSLFACIGLAFLPFMPNIAPKISPAPITATVVNTQMDALSTAPIQTPVAADVIAPTVQTPIVGKHIFTSSLIMLWLAGSALFLARLMSAGYTAMLWRTRATPLTARPELSLSKLIRIYESADVSAPMVCGLFTPALLVPTGYLSGADTDRVRTVCEHEIAHIVRGDLWVNFAQRLALAMLWWCAPLYWVNSNINIEREKLCDDRAAQVTGKGRALAHALVDLAEAKLRHPTPVLALSAVSGKNKISARIERLYDNSKSGSMSAGRLILCVGLLPLALLAMAITTPRIINAPAFAHEPVDIMSTNYGPLSFAQAQLYHAVQTQNLKAAKQLIADGISPNIVFRGEGTPLIEAVRNRDVDMIALLLGAGADVNLTSPSDGSPLIAAASLGYHDMVSLLVSNGADINLSSRGDGNPLIASALAGETTTAALLISLGANVNAQIQGDETPLTNAAQSGHISIVKLLVENGADVNLGMWADTQNGRKWRTPLGEAKINKHEHIASYLTAHGAQYITKPLPTSSIKIVEGRMTSRYGYFRKAHGKIHLGVDMAAKIGTPIYAPAKAKVIIATDLYLDNPKWGKVVVIETEGGVTTIFAHLNSYDVNVGDNITAGMQIAQVGNTGKSTGPHVHIATMIDGRHVDPAHVWIGLD